MGKLFKFIGILIGVILLLIIAAVVIIPLVIDPNDYKDEITAQVKKQTGRELLIGGDIDLSVFPWLGLQLGKTQLTNAEGFGDKPFAAVQSVAVRVKLRPLLSKQVEIDTIALDGLELNLAKASDGRSNWDDLTAAAEKEPEPAEKETAADFELDTFSIGGVKVSDARISWDDRSTGDQYVIDQFNFATGSITPGQPVDLNLDMVLESRQPQLKAKIDLQGRVQVDEQIEIIDISGLHLGVDAEGEALPTGPMRAELESGLKLNLKGQTLNLDGLKLSAGDLMLTGGLNGSNLDTQPQFSGNLNLAEFNLRKWLIDLGLALPAMADPKALTRFGAKLALDSRGSTTQLNQMDVRLDDTRINGSANLKGAAIGFNLKLDAIDVDRYLPPASAEKEQTSKPAPQSTGDEELIPVEALRGLDLDGVLTIGKLTITKLLAEDISLKVQAQKGRLNLNNEIKKFYQGSYKGVVNLDVSGNLPKTRIDTSAQRIQAEPLLKALTGEGRLAGTSAFNAKLNTQGNSVNAIKRGLDGNLDFRFEDGAVIGFNLAKVIRDTKARFSGKPVPKTDLPPRTDFSELSGSATIAKGLLTNKDLLAKSPFMRVNGSGQVNLPNETLDYTVKTVIVNTDKGQGGEGLEELKGVPIPVHLKGPYADPNFSVDWAAVLTGTQKAKVQEKIDEKKDELKGKIQDKLKGFLR